MNREVAHTTMSDGDSAELVAEGLEVGVAVAYEAVHVVMLSFEGLGQLHDNWPRLQECRRLVGVPVSYWSVAGWCPSGRSWDRIVIRVGSVGRCPGPASLIRALS